VAGGVYSGIGVGEGGDGAGVGVIASGVVG
jgi:hypothetical protein